MDDSLDIESYDGFSSGDEEQDSEEEILDVEKNEEEEKEPNSDDEEDGDDEEDVDGEAPPVRLDNTRGVPFLTKFEKARVLGVRAQQINSGGKIFVERRDGDTSLDIALRELHEKRMPLLIRRWIQNTFVDISVNELLVF